MTSLYITEYARQAKDNRGQPIAAGEEPYLATQKVGNAGASTRSAVFNVKTRFIRLHADSICSYKVGVGAQTATTGDPRLAANQTEYFGVIEEQAKGGTLEVATVLNT